MTAGLFLKSEAGGIQIDEIYPSFGLIDSGNLTISRITYNNWPPNPLLNPTYDHGATITVTGTWPILAFGGDYICGIKSTVNNGNGTWTFQVCAEAAAEDHTIPYYVFDNAKLVADEGCGLLVWNADGELVFASSQKPMRLVDITTGSLPAGWSNSQSQTTPPLPRTESWVYETGRDYAFAPLSTAYRYYWAFSSGGTPMEYWYEVFYGAKRISSGIEAQARILLSLSGTNHDSEVGNYETLNYGFLIFDVTDY